jgi:hypothetical protein
MCVRSAKHAIKCCDNAIGISTAKRGVPNENVSSKFMSRRSRNFKEITGAVGHGAVALK